MSAAPNLPARIPVWLPLWLALALFAIFQHGPMPLYSTRTLAVAWEMWQHGDWLVPHINGAPYSHKTPLLFWLIHAGWAVFGVNDVWPRVLQVGIGAAWLVAAAALARRVAGDIGVAASRVPWFLIALSYPFLFGVQIMYEVLLAAWVAAALYCLAGKPRWTLFALCVAGGLLTKGPVMLLHVAFPLVLGPWWNEHARNDRMRWYVRGALALAGGFALLVAWAWPAALAGGEQYRNELFFMQTAGRVVESFDHARPLWWYLPILPVLLFPWIAWPRLMLALARPRAPTSSAARFLVSWLLPTFAVFCLVSGKQVYYLLPLLPGAALAFGLALQRDATSGDARRRLGPWPLGIAVIGFAIAMIALPMLIERGAIASPWLIDASRLSPWFGVGLLPLGGLLLLASNGAEEELRRIAVVGLCGTVLVHALFAYTLFHNFDLSAVAHRLAVAQADGRAIAVDGAYEGQFHFAARLTGRVDEVEDDELVAWAAEHPHGLIVRSESTPTEQARRYALLIQPFRSRWLEVWDATTLAALRSGQAAPEPSSATELVPAGYWRYRTK